MSDKSNLTYKTLSEVNVNGFAKKKGNLTYLSWVYAWGKVKEFYPTANYKVYENANGLNYHTDGRTCWVKCSVTIDGLEHIEYLPVMDHRNSAISADKVTSCDVNKAIQRCITKACARHGLGIYIYAGEDMPFETEENKRKTEEQYVDLFSAVRDDVYSAISKAELQTIINEYPDMYNNYKPFNNLVCERWNKVQ